MTGFPSIKADAARTADDLERVVAYLKREYRLADDGDYNPEWEVSLEHKRVAELIEGLASIRGLLWHLGRNPEAAAALVEQHAEAMRAEVHRRNGGADVIALPGPGGAA